MTDRWMDLFGYHAPAVVTDTQREYRAVREAAGLMDFSMLRKVDLDGAGALALVDSIVCRDVSALGQGRIAYGPLCDADGMMVDDCTVMPRSAGGDRVRFCGANDRDYEIFSAAAEGLGIEVRERTDDLPHLCLQGPESRAILQGMTASDLSPEAFPYYTFREDVEVAGIPVFMTRLGYTAELGYELWADRKHALDLWDALLSEGARHGMEVIGMDALDVFRIEGGFIIGGVEYDPTMSPYECGLGWAVDLDKPGFQGREALRDAGQSSALRLTSVALEAGGSEASGAELTIDGSVVGFITQAVVSPYLAGKTLGLAKVERSRAEPGTAVEARVAGETVSGTIVRHPAYDPERRRVRS
jgi:glycine cleavage system aminomethyltransferase T